MKIALGADHAGLALKDHLREFLERQGHETLDLGTDSAESVDYPDFARAVAERVASGDAERGLLVCGTGVGMAMTANRVAGVRAANCNDLFCARLARLHNDANILTLGARVVAEAHAQQILELFLETAYEGGRHQRRVEKIHELDRPPS